MIQILIGVFLISSLATSGDLEKCTNALEKYDYWSKKTVGDDDYVLNPNNFQILLGKDMMKAWRKELLKECKNIVRKKALEAYMLPSEKQ